LPRRKTEVHDQEEISILLEHTGTGLDVARRGDHKRR
jgi:hypothetical protein